MRSAPTALKALLASNQFLMAELYTFVLVSGISLYYTDADINLTYGGNTFLATDAKIERKGIKASVGTSVDNLEIDVYAGTTNLVNGVPLLQAIAGGALDYADVTVQRVFMATWGDTSAGAITLLTGRVADVQATRTSATITVKSYLDLLQMDMPRNLYQANCCYSLYNGGCGVSAASMAVAGTVGASSTTTLMNIVTSQTAGWFSQGYVIFNSGQNAGLRRTIKSGTQSQLVLAYPLPSAPAAGDTVTLYPGCDHTLATCKAKFNNAGRFRAMPYIPVPETAT